MSRLKETYKNEIVDAMIKKFGYKNIMEVPKLDKIVVNHRSESCYNKSEKFRCELQNS